MVIKKVKMKRKIVLEFKLIFLLVKHLLHPAVFWLYVLDVFDKGGEGVLKPLEKFNKFSKHFFNKEDLMVSSYIQFNSKADFLYKFGK